MEENEISYSIVEYMSNHSGYRCGYCKTSDTNFSHGMWGHRMNVYAYYHLINRGWRRSGKYCYKPTMDKTCCPQYTIRCDSDSFKLSKSQKKVLKRMYSFLSIDAKKEATNSEKVSERHSEKFDQEQIRSKPSCEIKTSLQPIGASETQIKNLIPEDRNPQKHYGVSAAQNKNSLRKEQKHSSSLSEKKTQFKPGLGQDPSKALCKKAKLQRMERRASKKLLSSSSSSSPAADDEPSCSKQISASKANQEKTLEDHLNSPLPQVPAHKLELRLVPVSFHDLGFARSFEKSYELFKKYQMTVHGDSPNECDESSYKNFLIDGPLRACKNDDVPENGYGPFHQQYWLDEELIAVGVLDILPSAVSSVYFFYDPKFAHLSLGTYSSLREIALTRALSGSSSSVWRYYMGFYIHSCPKMRYKGQFAPSFLLCPETYAWVPIESCLSKLDISKYSKLSDLPQPTLHLDINKVKCLYDGSKVLYEDLRGDPNYDRHDEEEVFEYLTLVGRAASFITLLYRS